MGFTLDQFAGVRPFLYHLTAASNLARIRATQRLECAARLAEQAGCPALLGSKRATSIPLTIGEYTVSLRDQAPLHHGNVVFEDGWDLGRLISEINARVFFWPGTEEGPIPYGVRHFERYREEAPAIIRVATSAMPNGAEACGFNSGSPRCSRGVGSPRGPATYRPVEDSALTPGRVVEVTWRDAVVLPPDSWVGAEPAGSWAPLW